MTDVAAPTHPGEIGRIFHYHHHPRAVAHADGTATPPTKVRDLARRDTLTHRINSAVGLAITVIVGTMWCAYLFTVIAFLSFWQAITSKNLVIIIGWLSSNFLQLVLLPIIIVGQNLQGQGFRLACAEHLRGRRGGAPRSHADPGPSRRAGRGPHAPHRADAAAARGRRHRHRRRAGPLRLTPTEILEPGGRVP